MERWPLHRDLPVSAAARARRGTDAPVGARLRAARYPARLCRSASTTRCAPPSARPIAPAREILPRFRSVSVETQAGRLAGDRGGPRGRARDPRGRCARRSRSTAIVGEEYGGEGGAAGGAGSSTRSTGRSRSRAACPLFGTLIALRRGRRAAARPDRPARARRAHLGWRGGGCRRNGAPVRVSQRDRPRGARSSRTATRSRFELFGERRRVPAHGRARSRMLRGYTDASATRMVLGGGVDAMVDLYLNPWDAAATRLLVPEAGGRCAELRRGAAARLGLVFGSARAGRAAARLLSDGSPSRLARRQHHERRAAVRRVQVAVDRVDVVRLERRQRDLALLLRQQHLATPSAGIAKPCGMSVVLKIESFPARRRPRRSSRGRRSSCRRRASVSDLDRAAVARVEAARRRRRCRLLVRADPTQPAEPSARIAASAERRRALGCRSSVVGDSAARTCPLSRQPPSGRLRHAILSAPSMSTFDPTSRRARAGLSARAPTRWSNARSTAPARSPTAASASTTTRCSTERVAYAATEARAARELRRAASRRQARPRRPTRSSLLRRGGARDLVAQPVARLEPAARRARPRRRGARGRLPRRAARALCAAPARGACPRDRPPRGRDARPQRVAARRALEQVRASVREFAEQEVAPHAERIHRHDELVPESFIAKMAELGYFGLSVPEALRRPELGNLAMILTTEELSRASLAAAGSLITRPEILTKALLQGGTEAQKKRLAAADRRRRDHGRHLGDRARHRQRRRRREVPRRAPTAAARRLGHQRREGVVHVRRPRRTCWRCSRAPIPTRRRARRGLSLFIVPKDRFDGHEFEMRQPGGGRLVGKADARPATAACTPSRSTSRTTSCRPRTWSAARRASATASISRWRASRPAGCRPAAAPAASRRRRSRRPPSTWPTASSSGSRSPTIQLTQYTLGPHGGDARRVARDHLRRRARDGRGRARGGAARRAGEAPRLRHRRRGDAAGPADARRLGLRRGVPDQPLRRRRAGAADLRGREADPRAQGGRRAACWAPRGAAGSRRASRGPRGSCSRSRRPSAGRTHSG